MSTEPIIVLTNKDNTQPLRKWRATETVAFGLPIVATDLVADTKYKIEVVGDTDFTAIGASANIVGTVFTATGAGVGTGTAKVMVKRYNVKSGEKSDELEFNIWNNRKSNEVIDLQVAGGCTADGDVVITLNDVPYTVAVTVNTDSDLVATAIKDALELDAGFIAGWEVEVIPSVNFDGTKISNTILTFKALDFEPKEAFQFAPGSTGIVATMARMIAGNPATGVVSKITDAKIYIRDDQGGISSDVVTSKWGFIKDANDGVYTNLGVDINPETSETTEYELPLKALGAEVPEGEILGGVNDGLLTDEDNYDSLSFHMIPPATGVAQGLRQWKLLVTYNFT